jgi:hypothetical protein
MMTFAWVFLLIFLSFRNFSNSLKTASLINLNCSHFSSLIGLILNSVFNRASSKNKDSSF